MYYEAVGLLILLVVVLVATLANLYEKVERLERRLTRFESGPYANDESAGAEAFR
jgi:hypothetical protein